MHLKNVMRGLCSMKVVKISAVWCGSCINMKNIWREIEKEYDFEVINYDYDLDEEEVSKYNVGNILPVSIILNDENIELERIIGEKKKEEIISIISKYM